MSTHACWRLWAGVKWTDIDINELSEHTFTILNQLHDEPYKIGGLEIEHISMIGDEGGIGVVVKELHWTDENNIFDLNVIVKAKKTAHKLQRIFNGLGIEARVAIMHTIDLGG